MIDNYLDWAKRQRKYCVDCALRDSRIARGSTDDWAKGFYKGMALVYDFSGIKFKRLQKDIEARNRGTEAIMHMDLCSMKPIDILSQRGGKNV